MSAQASRKGDGREQGAMLVMAVILLLVLGSLLGGVAVLAGLSGGLFAGRHLLFDVTLSIATWLALFMMIVALRTLPDR